MPRADLPVPAKAVTKDDLRRYAHMAHTYMLCAQGMFPSDPALAAKRISEAAEVLTMLAHSIEVDVTLNRIRQDR